MKWIGITVSSKYVHIVQLEFTNDHKAIVNDDLKFPLQEGERPEAYKVMYKNILSYISENKIDRVVINSSATSQFGMSKGAILCAELRGVVMASAACSAAKVTAWSPAKVSRKIGTRTTKEYLKDDDFWNEKVASGSTLKIGSRPTATLILAVRQDDNN